MTLHTFVPGTKIESEEVNENFATINQKLSDIKEELNNETVKLSGDQEIEGKKTFTSNIVIPNPTKSTHSATKNYVDGKTNRPFLSALLGGENGGYINIYPKKIYRMTLSANNKDIIINETGYYFVFVQRLYTTGGQAIYLQVRLNGVEEVHAYMGQNQSHRDLHVSGIVFRSAGQLIQIYQKNQASGVWTNAHCRLSIFKIADEV